MSVRIDFVLQRDVVSFVAALKAPHAALRTIAADALTARKMEFAAWCPHLMASATVLL